LKGSPSGLVCRWSFSGRLYCTERALSKLNWFLRDFGYDAQLLKDDRVDERALLNLRGVVRTSYTTLNGRSYQNLEAGNEQLVAANLIRKAGASDLDWLDELVD